MDISITSRRKINKTHIPKLDKRHHTSLSSIFFFFDNHDVGTSSTTSTRYLSLEIFSAIASSDHKNCPQYTNYRISILEPQLLMTLTLYHHIQKKNKMRITRSLTFQFNNLNHRCVSNFLADDNSIVGLHNS